MDWSLRGAVTNVQSSGKAEIREDMYKLSTETVPSGHTFKRRCQRTSIVTMSFKMLSSFEAH